MNSMASLMPNISLFLLLLCFFFYFPTLPLCMGFIRSTNGNNTTAISTIDKMGGVDLNNSIIVERNSSRRELRSCATGNPIDDCWQCDQQWAKHRKRLADCVVGFGREAVGGKYGKFYVVTDSSDNDVVNPKRGTLRWGVIQSEPLWIIFAQDMVIKLKQELIVNNYKTIDGRGVNVHIAHGACITIQYVSHIIVHGIHIHDCVRTGPAMVRSSPQHYGWRTTADGDGISIFGSNNIWIDHCYLARCADGLIDAVMSSTAITISNNLFTQHDKVMLLGHSDAYTADRTMQVTIAYNHFGEGLVQRMPRCRHGYFEIINNDYTHWEMYAIGGSANPIINSQGNRYLAPINRFSKQVTMRIDASQKKWKNWVWRSTGDMFLNGAYFTQSGSSVFSFQKSVSIGRKPSTMVGAITANAGVLKL